MKPNFNKLTVNQMLNGFVKVFYLLLLFVISGCNNKNHERREISVEEILISANKKNKIFKDIETGSFKYTIEQDGLKEFSLHAYEQFKVDSKQDSTFFILDEILSDPLNYGGLTRISIDSVSIVFDPNYILDNQVGICNISSVGKVGNKLLLYFSYRCGKACGNGYVIVGELKDREEYFDVKQVYHVWTAS